MLRANSAGLLLHAVTKRFRTGIGPFVAFSILALTQLVEFCDA